MDEREEAQLRIMLKPMCDIVGDSYMKAMILRCNVHQRMALLNGAELEDIAEVIARAIESAQPITKDFLDKISEMDKAIKIAKENRNDE